MHSSEALQFVDDRHDQNCIQFLIACNTLEANYDSLPDEEAIEDAMSIYDKYAVCTWLLDAYHCS